LLAASPEAQNEHLQSGSQKDAWPLFFEFYDVYAVVGELDLSEEQLQFVDDLATLLDRRNDSIDDPWGRDALWTDPEWKLIRICAWRALGSLLRIPPTCEEADWRVTPQPAGEETS
jgi:hypothetical protein